MDPIKIHQTSLHAVLVLDAAHIDPASVATIISPNGDNVDVKFNQHQDTHLEESITATATTTRLTVRPLLTLPGSPSREESVPAEVLEACNFLVSPSNLVVRFTKSRPVEWQALQIELQKGPLLGETLLAKFATASNADTLQKAIQQSHLWPGIGELEKKRQLAVCNVQAKKEPGENSILLTAELVSRDGTGSSAASASTTGP
ncbi:hypothetical protein EMPS_10589 [Entomortierella parvispora]|uniref:Uncharacterized protein n=1 Tax=Entomortierella parvispora TaxID=205924 RepID=A0A9P3HKG1_9FUNG|nr:hypothetical protein EMPS_10589 [Entomortierella parvispora]